MRPGVVEYANTSGTSVNTVQMNRGYGTLRNIYVGHVGTMSPGQDGRRINAVNYLYFNNVYDVVGGGSSSNAFLLQHTEFLS